MNIRWPAVRLDRAGWLNLAGGATSVVVAVLLYTRFSIDGTLSRDESIYVYGGQQMTHGVAPYASVFDPKTPLATMMCGLGAALARLFGTNDVNTIRVVFFVSAVLSALAIYVFVRQVWGSTFGGVVAAVVFISFHGFARDALAGPDAKTPGILFAVVSMWLAVRRRWFWAGVAGGLVFLDWQPYVIYPVMVVVAAAVWSPGKRWRESGIALAGAAAPVVLTIVYFAASGALGDAIQSTIAYPATGVHRVPETYFHRLRHIARTIQIFYKFSGYLILIGLVLFVVVLVTHLVSTRYNWPVFLADPVTLLVASTLVVQAGYMTLDFQSFPDVYALLPYPAIGFGAAAALLVRRLEPRAKQSVVAAGLVAAAVLTAFSWSWFTNSSANTHDLVGERAAACAVDRLVLPGTPLYALGNPVPLVLTKRRNPDHFIYLTAGVDAWKVHHTHGGFAGWVAQIRAKHPSVIVLDAWVGRYRDPMVIRLLADGYARGYVAKWRVFLTPEAAAQAPASGVRVTTRPTKWPQTLAMTKFMTTNCA
jgi:hypothetical protein